MERLSYTATQQGRRFDDLDGPFRNFITRRGISRAEWDKLRDVPALDIDGAKFFDIDAVADAKLGEKLMAGSCARGPGNSRYATLQGSA